jgi:ribosomal protein L6P/L9E
MVRFRLHPKWPVLNEEGTLRYKYIDAMKCIATKEFNSYRGIHNRLNLKAPLGHILKEMDYHIAAVPQIPGSARKTGFVIRSEPLDQAENSEGRRINKKRWNLYTVETHLLRKKITDMTNGVVDRLKIKGMGKRGWKTRTLLHFKLGHSHPMRRTIPQGMTMAFYKRKTILRVFGSDRAKLHDFLHNVIRLRPTFAYKDIGIRYANEKPRIKKRKVVATT